MSLKQTLLEDIKVAMKSGDKERLLVLRTVHAAIKQREIDERIELDDANVLSVFEKMVKQRRESEKMYREGKRDDLADKEVAEIEIIQHYLPEPLSAAELEELINHAIADTGASSIRDMGKVMGKVKASAAGRADMGEVGKLVKARLA